MDFTIKNIQENIVGVARQLGYVIIDTRENGEYNLVRKLQLNNYPRFHAYVKQQGSDFVFSLHLDQKAPVYKGVGVHAHSGEYFGPLIDEESDRIKKLLSTKDKPLSKNSLPSGWEN
ncbi:MAG: hypothetical protein NT155_04220 [Candidatus Staskawiczbacteria bacterium]|nr:hypothetical protein [Candidatus Staskawiczbacteria bacterium]